MPVPQGAFRSARLTILTASRGEGLDFVVMDECAFIHEDALARGATLRTGRLARPGDVHLDAEGHNWFWRSVAAVP